MSSQVSSPTRPSRTASPVPSSTQQSVADMTDSSDDEDILRPRGRLAARLQKQNVESGSDTETANDQADDDDIVTTRPRKLIQRRRRSSTPGLFVSPANSPVKTPAKSPARTTNSPGQFVSPSKSTAASPGLFVSPSKPASPGAESDNDDLPQTSLLAKNPRFLALVAQKAKQRKAREAEEARKRAERLTAQKRDDDMSMIDDEDDDNITDDEGGRKLTQSGARPSRKASKKAMDDMTRETQRLARSMQLVHEAKVKKKITKNALFERFNYKPEGTSDAPKISSSRPTSPASGAHTDAEMKDAETPPSSPPAPARNDAQEPKASVAPVTTFELEENSDGELPTLEDALQAAAAKAKLDKGKGKATTADFEAEDRLKEKQAPAKRKFRVKLPEIQANRVGLDLGGDDDLVIEHTRKNRIDAIFDRIPVNQAKESRPMHMLRKLAHLDDPDKKAPAVPSAKNRFSKQAQQPAMSVGELEATLLQRARTQAKLERDRQVEMLRSKGITVLTSEEREKQEQEVENMVARARREAEEIMAREREAAKKERKARREAGEDDPLGWDDSDDSDFGTEEEAELELSGSEEEGEAEDADEAEEEADEADPAGGLFDEAAESAAESEEADAEEVEQEAEEAEQEAGQETDEEVVPNSKLAARSRPRKQVVILSDDEDETGSVVEATPRPKTFLMKSPAAPNTVSPKIPTSVLRSATKPFIPGLPVAGPAGLGLTQIFAGTMDDSQTSSALNVADSPSQPRPTFDVDAFPESNFSQTAQEVGVDMIMDSQPAGRTQNPETQGVQLHFSQSQAHGLDTLLRESQDASQMSELIEPTQDAGYQNYSPLLHRFVEAPASTTETVRLQSEDHSESPLVRRTGKLRRRADLVVAEVSEDEAENAADADDADEFGFGTKASAFNVMKKAAIEDKKKKAAEAFDKKKSKAREMIEEQAEESEDEYAGLGGVDGEESDNDDDAQSVKEMIDDETKATETDERKLAAFFADRERASDEKQVNKLFHDLTTGALRRKRGGDWDDLDEDDGGEARRRLKRRQFAKMQRALMADERISKVAENPANQAFLRTIEDRGSDDEMDFIFEPAPLERQDSSTSEEQGGGGEAVTIPDSQPEGREIQQTQNPRRTKGGSKKPSNLGDIRESLSNLLDEPLNSSSSIIPATEVGSDSEDEDEPLPPPSRTSSTGGSSNKENRNPRRTTGRVVDRITLKRNSSSTISTSSRLAFATATNSSSSTSSLIKVPALLRRATTNSLLSSSSSSSTMSATGVTTHTTHNGTGGGGPGQEKIKKPAGKKSGVNYFARENERRAKVAEMERRREERKVRGAEGRGRVVGGLFGGGRFE
ncbi:mediator of replication checkpoint protein 1 [Echria macrotheca]|uniref:Mediator of replication checkpoint protein 1 n=1 Tax=Echria macrotheca TaxID=438768 RepID=A0AAJ0F7I7_9PEZI|nr:mediator of replication checkpoint protein 1 [Echria macrotheca]